MLDKYLPVGSIVLLSGGTKRLMITGYCMQTEERPGVIYDYSGCLYPEGVIRSDVTSVFNHDQIEKIDFVGFIDEEGKAFTDELSHKLEDVKEHNRFIIEEDEEEEEDLLELNVLNDIGTEPDGQEEDDLIFNEDDDEDEEDDDEDDDDEDELEEFESSKDEPFSHEEETPFSVVNQESQDLNINNSIFDQNVERI